MSEKFTVRAMTKDEMIVAVDWAAREGWNPGLNDAETFYSADPGGFFIAVSDKNEPLGFVSAVDYGGGFGFIGFFIVRPDLRGQSIGIALGRTAMERLAKCNIGLDGVINKVGNYKAFGFKLAYKNIRFSGICAGQGRTSAGITELSGVPFEQVAEFDRKFFPAERKVFLKNWINQPGCYALGLKHNGGLSAMGVARKCLKGFKIGPLFAETPQAADTMMKALLSYIPEGQEFFLDIPEANPEAVALVGRYGMIKVFETARMYSGPAPELPIGKIFGVTSFELG